MPNKRSSLAILAGVGLLPLVVQKVRGGVSTYFSDAPLLQIHEAPILMPPVSFTDSGGMRHSFADFPGKHLLVNIWAMWCAPCRKELPSLDRLQEKLGPVADPMIVALSVDSVGIDQLRAFYAANDVRNLAIYQGDESDIIYTLRIAGLPTTLLFDHQGMEIARLIGPTTWDAPKVVEQISKLVAVSPLVAPTAK